MNLKNPFSLQYLMGFMDEFFDQNPISQLGFIITKDKRAEKASELSGKDVFRFWGKDVVGSFRAAIMVGWG